MYYWHERDLKKSHSAGERIKRILRQEQLRVLGILFVEALKKLSLLEAYWLTDASFTDLFNKKIYKQRFEVS